MNIGEVAYIHFFKSAPFSLCYFSGWSYKNKGGLVGKEKLLSVFSQ